jgi:hypothetical protein
MSDGMLTEAVLTLRSKWPWVTPEIESEPLLKAMKLDKFEFCHPRKITV